MTVPDEEELLIGRFRYGENRQILVAKARRGSYWELGASVIIVPTDTSQSTYKIWRGQREFADIPDHEVKVKCRFLDIKPTGTISPLAGSMPQFTSGTAGSQGVSRVHPSRVEQLGLGLSIENVDGAVQGQAHLPKKPSSTVEETETAETSGLSPRTANTTAPTSASVLACSKFAGPRGGKLETSNNPSLLHSPFSQLYGNASKRSRAQSVSPVSETSIPGQIRRVKTSEMRLQPFHDHTSNSQQLVYEDVSTGATPSYLSTTRPGLVDKIGAPSKFPEAATTRSKLDPAETVHLEKPGEMRSKQQTVHKASDDVHNPKSFSTQDDATTDLSKPKNPFQQQLQANNIGFNITYTTIFFADATDEIVDESDFSEIQDCTELFSRAFIVDVISKTTQLLEIEVGDKIVRVQRGFERDFERLKGRIVRAEATEVKVCSGD